MSSRRIQWLLIGLALAALLIAGRLYRLHLRKEWLKPVIVEQRGDLIDLTLPVISKSCDAHGGCVVETSGLYENRPTGLTLIFAPNMKPSVFTGKMATTQIVPTRSGITMIVEGPRGNSLLHLLSKNYELPLHEPHLPVNLALTAITLEGDPASIQSQPLRFETIHPRGKDSPEYFELFIDADLASNNIHLIEKNSAFRSSLFKALGAN
jgi:hypothetical protein